MWDLVYLYHFSAGDRVSQNFPFFAPCPSPDGLPLRPERTHQVEHWQCWIVCISVCAHMCERDECHE